MNFLETFLFRILKRFVFVLLYTTAEGTDEASLDENTKKHVRAILNCVLVVPVAFVAIRWGGTRAGDIIFYVSIAAQIAGLAWFVISFAALPQRHLNAAMMVTEAMFSSFLAGVFSLLVFAAVIAPLCLLVVVPIYWWLYKAAAMYDSADLLKAGKDEQEILAAKATQRMEHVLAAIADKIGARKEADPDSDPPT